MNFACFSVAAMDFFPQQNCYRAGGNSLNQAIHLAKLGHKTTFAGAVGNDPAGNAILQILEASGVDTSYCKQLVGDTACNRIINDEHGERFGEEGAWKNGVYGQHTFDDATWQYLKSCDVWCTHCGDPHFDQAVEFQINESRLRKLCVDFLHLPDPDQLRKTLPAIDLAFIGGNEELIPFAKTTATQCPEKVVVVTLGSAGSVAFHNKKQWLQPALPVGHVFDTTGCGDAFQAAFTATYFSTGGDIEASLLAGAKRGRENTQHYGAQPSVHP